ncbi:uncharacterized protein BX664DRAFT_338648 [Halteromyces radiatus]|uniref:uncharacterized protein n=1 Tax=Halteromyces radiatus TaxID=101107 RepID=UPI0022202E58|nr:uncharacterized protein BX664DRAFT_338648 [Halteromyces radiatus]KAI8085153.1 hypothetical protein BX664DRAFT_338648 [Halteromyces radiatus]
MAPNPNLPFEPPTTRRFSSASIPQPVYLGLDVQVTEARDQSSYSISVHDGSYTTDYYTGLLCKHPPGMTLEQCMNDAVEELKRVVKLYCASQSYKIQIIACSYKLNELYLVKDPPVATTMSDFWRELDAIPFIMHTDAHSSDERASAAVRKAVMLLSPQYPGNLPRISVGFRHEVEVDFNRIIHLVDLEDYRTTVAKETWRVWNEIAAEFKRKNLTVSFFNSTPQGGGVALMRHALVRFLNLNGIQIHWYVARPKPEVFDVTKRKFHNVLQGVAPPDVRLTDEDKQMFVDWSNENAERFWVGEKGPIRTSDVIVIDDPQLSGIIPHIKLHSPRTRVIFRSHIEIRADLIRDDPTGPQAETWNFLWQFIKQADLFIAHPMRNFIPDDVPRENVMLLPACTDPLDGLNKPLTHWCTTYYRSVFNRVCMDQGANEVDWNRPYVVQVARFDPSKGIPDVLEAYRLLRQRLDADDKITDADIPQLVLCGHGSIDDPDGSLIYGQTYALINTSPFSSIVSDIIVARLQPSDQLLNMVLSGARVALQLSHREGFEVKVTEALQKGVPVIAYEAGGIPLQIQRDVTGFLAPIGDVDAVADYMYRLLTDHDLRERMSNNARQYLTEEYFTIWNSMSWLHMFNEMTCPTASAQLSNGLLDVDATKKRNNGLGDAKYVRSFWFEKYQFKPPTSFVNHICR